VSLVRPPHQSFYSTIQKGRSNSSPILLLRIRLFLAMNSLSYTSKAISIGPIGNDKAVVPKSKARGVATANQLSTLQQCCTTVGEKQKAPGLFRLTVRQHPPRYLSTSTMCRIKHGKNWRDAIAALQDVERQGYVPDKFMYRAVITKCGKQGQWVECLKLLNSMQIHGVKLDAAVFNAAILGVAKAGKKEQALGLLREMIEESGVMPNVRTFTIAVGACGGDWRMALALFDMMKKQGIDPDCFSYSAVIASCEKGGQAGAALELYAEMTGPGTCIAPNEVIYCSLVKACFEATNYALALKFVREAKAKRIYPDFDTSRGEWDLCQPHGPSESTSCMLIADALISTAESLALFPFGSFGDICIITGKSTCTRTRTRTRTRTGGVLRHKIPKFLTDVLGIKLSFPQESPERIVISSRALQDWVCTLDYKVFKSVFLYDTADLWRCVL